MADQDVPPFDLKAWRKGLGLTQDQAAFLFGLTRQGFQKKEKAGSPGYETRYAALYLLEHPDILSARLQDFVPTQ